MGNGLSFLSVFGLTLTIIIITKPRQCTTDTSKGCSTSLNIHDPQTVPDSQFTSSAFVRNYYLGYGKYTDLKPNYARLDGSLAWCVRHRKRKPEVWLMVDLGEIMNLTGIATQGFVGVNDYFVKSFKVLYSQDGTIWKWALERNEAKIFDGNSDGVGTVRKTFPNAITARFVKILPVSCHIMACLRIELYGCKDNGSRHKIPAVTSMVMPTPTATTAPSSRQQPVSLVIPRPVSPTISPSAKTLAKSATLTLPSNRTAIPSVVTVASSLLATTASVMQISPTVVRHVTKKQTSTTTSPMVRASTALFNKDVAFTSSGSHQGTDSALSLPVVIGCSLGGLALLVLILLISVKLRRLRGKRSASDHAELLVIEAPIDDITFQVIDDKQCNSCHTQLILATSRSKDDMPDV